MYLRTIKLAGFKSFVDPTLIPVRARMSAIVGPNGCGKSNVVDAIRWVIGESSAKQLRGQSMSDVIFNGTTSRKPVGKASVELHFDNSAGRITGEYAEYSEIVIRREVEREGQSSYFLNGTHCRRRDILDIFLGTGLGPRSYSIIEQGMISQLIEAKPEEMRAYFEEVAGISKYKERRRETENRIQHTQDNLSRLNDMRDELTKQLRHLQRQANAAERYKVYKQEERELSAQIKGLQWRTIEQNRVVTQDRVNQQMLEREKQLALQREQEVEIDKIKIDQEEAKEQQHAAQKRYYALGEEIARLESQIKYQQEQIQRWQRELLQSQSTWTELNDNMLEHQSQINELETEVNELAPQTGTAGTAAERSRTALTQAERQMQVWTETWDKFQEESSRVSSQAQVLATKIEHHQQQLGQLQQRQQNLQKQLSDLPLQNVHSQIDPLRLQGEELRDRFDETKESLENIQQKILDQRAQNKLLQQNLQTKQRESQQLESQHATLHALQQVALGCDDKNVNQWLAQQKLTSQSRIGQEIEVNTGWETAVETILSGYFDAVCVDNIENYAAGVNEFGDGRLTLLEKLTDNQHSSPLADTLLSQIKSAWPLQQWLEGIFIAEDIESALQIRSKLAADQSVITKNGVWLGKNWMRVSKIQDPQSGVLEREKNLSDLVKQMADMHDQIDEIHEQIKTAENELANSEQTREALQQQYQQINTQLSEARVQYKAATTRFEELLTQEKRLNAELQQLSDQSSQIQQQIENDKDHQFRLNDLQTELNSRREELTQNREQYRSTLEKCRVEAQKHQQQADELEIRLSSNENQLTLLRQMITRDEKQLAALEEKKELLMEQLSSNETPVEEQQSELQEKLTLRLRFEEELKVADRLLAEKADHLKRLENAKKILIEESTRVQEELDRLRMQNQEMTVRQETIKEQLQEAEWIFDNVMQMLPQDANIQEWETRLQQLTDRINRLGAINLAAIDEHRILTERKDYLDKQFADLTESLETLQTAIRKIDRETKTRFQETFDKVNQNFQALFPRIFTGGRASLELCEDDLLKTGILVKAQPPGKRNSTIHMLSGGEKALTAISLVFALFQLNPAPFCILDEVDAPLDDLNVSRFCALVKDMSKDVQFLIISHNKVTIEMADHLMGVTMQEPGVSRLVAVDMAAALEMAGTD